MFANNNLEIEYRYLLKHLPVFHISVERSEIIQGYLLRSFEQTVRIRIETLPDGTERAFKTDKGPKTGASGSEIEEEIKDLAEARAAIEKCKIKNEIVEKNRYKVPVGNGLIWEVDEFKGKLTGLFIAEIELPSEDTPYAIPHWLDGVDITTDRRFANAVLVDVGPDKLKEMISSVLAPKI